jgi:hypothetical protein
MDPLEPIDRIDPADPMDRSEPAENADPNEAAEPTEVADSAEPTDRHESTDARERDDRREVATADDGTVPASLARRRRGPATSVVVARTLTIPFEGRAAALVVEALGSGRPRRSGPVTRRPGARGTVQPGGQALPRQLAVAPLRAGVQRPRRHLRAERGDQAVGVRLGQPSIG